MSVPRTSPCGVCGCSPGRGWKGDASWKGVLSGQEAAFQLGPSRESVAVQVRHPRAPFRMGVGQGLEGPKPCPDPWRRPSAPRTRVSRQDLAQGQSPPRYSVSLLKY